jgi:hypothetical protein
MDCGHSSHSVRRVHEIRMILEMLQRRVNLRYRGSFRGIFLLSGNMALDCPGIGSRRHAQIGSDHRGQAEIPDGFFGNLRNRGNFLRTA